MHLQNKPSQRGFTLIEVLVVISIIGILVSILVLNFDEARKQSRDQARKSDLQAMQLAIETYKAQNGTYPAQGCGNAGQWAGAGTMSASWGASCNTYIVGLAPDFIPQLARDPNQEDDDGKGFIYRTNGSSYKLMVHRSVEASKITSFADEFSRCPKANATNCPTVQANEYIYAVYSAGAEDW